MDFATLSDIYIPVDCPEDVRAYNDGIRVKGSEHQDLESDISKLLKSCQELDMKAGEDRYLMYQSTSYRVHLEQRKTTLQFTLRRMPPFRPSLEHDNPEGVVFPSELVEAVNKQLDNNGGLYLVSGPLGSGKTTTLAAFMNFMLTHKGGVGWALEDPPEYDLEGDYGDNGVCYQHPVGSGDFAQSIRSMMRCFPAGAPAFLMVGEIRDHETAEQVLKALLNGAHVMFTLHAGDLVGAMTRFLSLCEKSDYAREIVASTMRLLVNQHKTKRINGNSLVEFEFLEGDQSLQAVILKNNMTGLKDVVIQQRNYRKSISLRRGRNAHA